jgi:hypothetical protein
MAAVALLKDIVVTGNPFSEAEDESLVAERVSSRAAETVLGGNVSVADRSGVVKPMSWVVAFVLSTPRRAFAAPGDAKFRGYEKSRLDRN